jgi:hypothetical protein
MLDVTLSHQLQSISPSRHFPAHVHPAVSQ